MSMSSSGIVLEDAEVLEAAVVVEEPRDSSFSLPPLASAFGRTENSFRPRRTGFFLGRPLAFPGSFFLGSPLAFPGSFFFGRPLAFLGVFSIRSFFLSSEGFNDASESIEESTSLRRLCEERIDVFE